MGRGTSRRAPSEAAWGITVRLADGTVLHLRARQDDAARHGDAGWGRESQAHRFTTAEEAERVVAGFQTNSAAKEYAVVRLPSRRGR